MKQTLQFHLGYCYFPVTQLSLPVEGKGPFNFRDPCQKKTLEQALKNKKPPYAEPVKLCQKWVLNQI